MSTVVPHLLFWVVVLVLKDFCGSLLGFETLHNLHHVSHLWTSLTRFFYNFWFGFDQFYTSLLWCRLCSIKYILWIHSWENWRYITPAARLILAKASSTSSTSNISLTTSPCKVIVVDAFIKITIITKFIPNRPPHWPSPRRRSDLWRKCLQFQTLCCGGERNPPGKQGEL